MTPNIVKNSSQPEIHDFQIWSGLTTNYASLLLVARKKKLMHQLLRSMISDRVRNRLLKSFVIREEGLIREGGEKKWNETKQLKNQSRLLFARSSRQFNLAWEIISYCQTRGLFYQTSCDK